MAYRNMVYTPQVIDLESERGHPPVHSESFNHNGNDLPNQGAQHAVRVVGNATNVGLSEMRSYYDVSLNHPQQPVHSSPPNLGVDSGFVFPSSMYNPCMSTTSMNRYVSHAQSFGLPLNQVVPGSMDESSRNEHVGESARGFLKRKNAAVAGSYHFVNGFACSSSSSHASQNPTYRPWDPSFESNVLPNIALFNPSEYHSHSNWPSLEGSSVTGTNGFNSISAHPESAQHGNYTFPTSHVSQCFQPTSNTWISQAANGITDGVPQWEYINAMTNAPGRFAHSGATEIVNGGFGEYQTDPSTICRGPLHYYHQHAMHNMQSHNLLDHTQMQAPYQQCHNSRVLHGGVNHSGNRLHLGPRIPVLFSNSERSFEPPQHPFLANPVNHRNIRILPPEHGTIMDFLRLYGVSNVVDEHRDMRLDIDSMTYEELLALEEQIGDVNTGLAKSHIVEKLKTSLYVPGISCKSDESSESSMENGACIICQEEYQVEECIGTLDCGHRYHAECIKQWLMVLPPVPKIEIQLGPHHKALPVGTISAIMGERVIVEGSVQRKPLNEGSILWITESRTPLGVVDELFGPVKNPYYLVRYNSEEEVPAGISAGTAVSFVTEFADHILNMKELYSKGYDSSGDHDKDQSDEPEFSDDEKEAEYKRSLRLAKRQTDRQHESKKPSGDKKRAQPRGAGFRKDMPPRICDAPTPGHQSPPHFHRPDMSPVVADNGTRPLGPQNFPTSAPTMLSPVPMNPAIPSAVQLANQMGGCFINPSQQFLPQQQPNVVWPGRPPPPPYLNMGVEGAAFAANIMQNILIGANHYQQQFQNQNFGGFPNQMPMPPPQFMPQSAMPVNPMPFCGPPVNPPFGPARPLPMGQGNFGQPPHMAGEQGLPPGFTNPQGFGRLPTPPGDGQQPPTQFNSGQFNQGSSSFRGIRPQQRGGRHSSGRGGGRHSPGRGGGRHRK